MRAIAATTIVLVMLAGCSSGDKKAGPTAPAPSPNAPQQPADAPPAPAPAPVISGFRGDGTGQYPKAHPPTEWDNKKNVKWHVKVGTAYSSPVVCGDSVFVT